MIDPGMIQAVARRYLEVARNALEMDVAWLSEHTGTDQVLHAVGGDHEPFGIGVGTVLPWEVSYCSRVLDGRFPAFIPDTRAHPEAVGLSVTDWLGIGSYAGAPVHLPGGQLFGMLCCVGRAARPQLGAPDARLLAALASSLGEDLATVASRHPAEVISREEVERVVAGEGLAMVLQPIVRLEDMKVVGAEALARFHAPAERPDRWFARAARLGLGTELEMTAVRAALRLLPDLPADVYLSVNVSPETVCARELRDVLAGVDARRVVVEITEHSSVSRYDQLIGELAELRELGARVAVDDAGAGYSSFRHILALRPDLIKLDSGVVRGVDGDRARETLVGALASFAESLGATVVAEGVETAGELDTLVRAGVGCGQGFYLARPGALPLPVIQVRPLRATPPPRLPAADFASFIPPLLAEVAAVTGLEASYLSVRHVEDGTLEHVYVHDPAGLGIPVGGIIPWTGSLCQRCHHEGIVWTADLHRDLPAPGRGFVESIGTFLSVPVFGAGGDEVMGTLCAASRERRHLAHAAVQEVKRISRGITERQALRVGEPFGPPAE